MTLFDPRVGDIRESWGIYNMIMMVGGFLPPTSTMDHFLWGPWK